VVVTAEPQRVGCAGRRHHPETIRHQVVAEQLQSRGIVLTDNQARGLSSLGEHVPPLRLRRRKLSPLARGNLQNSASTSMGNDAPCGDCAADSEEQELLIEEVEVEGKAHAEGVNARTAGDEKARTCLIAVQMGESKQPGASPFGNGNLQAEHGRNREATQAWSKENHALPRPSTHDLSPTRPLLDQRAVSLLGWER